MDYNAASIPFKVRKVWRYGQMFGWRRTWAKVQAHRHQSRHFDVLPTSHHRLEKPQQVGLIGCGNYAFANIAYFLHRAQGRVIGGCMDKNPHRAASLARHYGAPLHTTDAEELLENDHIRLLYIASNHASHAEYAIRGLEHGKDVYIEKPHVVDDDQLDRLTRAMQETRGRVYLGFNRPGSKLGRTLRRALDEQPGAGVYNWFVAGHEIDPDHWYFHPREGGRVLGNLCHWTDFLYVLLGPRAFPIQITPVSARSSDVDIAVNYVFGDGSIGVITFSAKGHTFDGVRERFSAHQGNCLAVLEDFASLTVEIVDKKRCYRGRHRDHGHRDNILGAYRTTFHNQPYDHRAQLERIVNTAHLFLRTKEALETGRTLTIHAADLGGAPRAEPKPQARAG